MLAISYSHQTVLKSNAMEPKITADEKKEEGVTGTVSV
jgi:hypothetical protein